MSVVQFVSDVAFLGVVDLDKNEIRNVRMQNLATPPSSPGVGQFYFDTSPSIKAPRVWDGTGWVTITDAWISGVTGTAPIVATTANGITTISITAATASAAGSMSAADKSKLDKATAANTASTIVIRDANGGFSAGTITGTLTGTASNATQLAGQAASYYLDRANHTGTQAASTISNLKAVVTAYRLDEFAAPTAAVSLGNQRLTNLASPSADTDAATKAYVDANLQGLDIKDSVRVATTANITLSGTQTIDGIALSAGNRVLVKDQTDAKTNGIYVVASGAWTRAADANSSAKVTAGMFTFVEEGAVHDDTGWVLSTNNPITLGTTNLSFTQFSGAGSIEAGNGLVKTGNQLSVGAGTGITVTASAVQISATYAGQTSITTVGTITNGTWNGTAIAIARGGTGATSAAQARTNLGAAGKFSATIGDGTAVEYTLNHNFNTRAVTVSVQETAAPYSHVFAATESTSVNSVKLTFAKPPANGSYLVTVVG